MADSTDIAGEPLQEDVVLPQEQAEILAHAQEEQINLYEQLQRHAQRDAPLLAQQSAASWNGDESVLPQIEQNVQDFITSKTTSLPLEQKIVYIEEFDKIFKNIFNQKIIQQTQKIIQPTPVRHLVKDDQEIDGGKKYKNKTSKVKLNMYLISII